MSIFTEKSFERFTDKLFVIHPMREENVTGVGYDLTIGYYLKIIDDQIDSKEQGEVTDQSNLLTLELEPHSSLLIVTKEHAYLSNRIAGQIHIRATYAAQGIFMNSTTVDPCWNGQQVFLMSNLSLGKVKIPLNEHFCTLVLHDVKHRSYKSPNNTRSVLEKYVNTYKGETAKIFGYIMKTTEITKEYEDKVDKVKLITNKNEVFLKIYLIYDLIRTKNERSNNKIFIFFVSFIIFFLAWYFKLNIGDLIDQNLFNIITILGSLGSLISCLITCFQTSNKSKEKV